MNWEERLKQARIQREEVLRARAVENGGQSTHDASSDKIRVLSERLRLDPNMPPPPLPLEHAEPAGPVRSGKARFATIGLVFCAGIGVGAGGLVFQEELSDAVTAVVNRFPVSDVATAPVSDVSRQEPGADAVAQPDASAVVLDDPVVAAEPTGETALSDTAPLSEAPVAADVPLPDWAEANIAADGPTAASDMPSLAVAPNQHAVAQFGASVREPDLPIVAAEPAGETVLSESGTLATAPHAAGGAVDSAGSPLSGAPVAPDVPTLASVPSQHAVAQLPALPSLDDARPVAEAAQPARAGDAVLAALGVPDDAPAGAQSPATEAALPDVSALVIANPVLSGSFAPLAAAPSSVGADGTPNRVLASLGTAAVARGQVDPLASVSLENAPPAFDAEVPTPGLLRAEDMALWIFAASTVPEALVASTQASVGGLGLPLRAVNRVGYRISENQVRFYDAGSEPAATRLAAEIDAVARDFTGSNANPPPGTLEVYLAGDAPPQRTVAPRQPVLSEEERLRNEVILRLRAGLPQ